MPEKLPGNPNLPPGVTNRDIDRAAGVYDRCDNCGKEVMTDKLDKDMLCPKCQDQRDYDNL